jgi:alpha-glucosidase (family GH31 glycosyl hydrolase)
MRLVTTRPTLIRILAISIFLCAPLAFTIAAQSPAPPAPNPVADPRAIIVSGQARFTVLTPQLIRIEWADDSKFEDHATLVFINRLMPVPSFKQSIQKGWLTIDTGKLVLRYKQKSGVFTAENLQGSFSIGTANFIWHPGLIDTGNLGGTIRTLDGARGPRPLDPGLLSRDGWVLVDDSATPLFDNSDWPWAMARPPAPAANAATPRLDWYLFAYGHEYRAALRDFTQVSGRIPLPPRFAFGVWWSRYWAYTDAELQDLVREFHDHTVPLDVLVIDMDWHPTFGTRWWENKQDASGHSLGWTGYSWNNTYFPDPPEFLRWAHSEGLRVTLNMHPASGVQPFEVAYPEMARAMGIDPATKQFIPFDIANKKFATNYMDILHRPLEKQGVDFFWLDWQQERTTSLPGLNPTWWLNYVHFTDMEREGKRPLIYHRWGGLGNHRYQIGFSGDVISDWTSLAFQPQFTATAANVGYGYWSHDIGGHLPGPVEAELYTRWLQWGAFSPILRTHMTKDPGAERRAWAFPEPYAEVMRNALLLRHSLIPYLYTSARETYDTGISICHPLYYDYPESPESYGANTNGEYAFGDSMIVAPVTSPLDPASQLAKRSIWLPPGDWIEWTTGARLHGPASLTRTFRLDEIPVYVRAGIIIPMQSATQSAEHPEIPALSSSGGAVQAPPRTPPVNALREQLSADPLILEVFPDAPGEGHLYEDSSDSLAYKGTAFARTNFHQQFSGDTRTIEILPPVGGFAGMAPARAYELRLTSSFPPVSVTVNGQPVVYSGPESAPFGWRYDGDTTTTIIELPRFSITQKVEVLVKYSAHSPADDHLLDGAAGKIARLHGAMHILEGSWSRGWAPDILLDAAQTGRRISLHPESALDELRRLDKNWPDILKAINDLDVDRVKFIDPALAHLKN